MRLRYLAGVILLVVFLAGCAPSRRVTVVEPAPHEKYTTAALVPQDGNSPTMDAYLQQMLLANGITLKAPLPANTLQSNEVDMIVKYLDIWRWDMTMFLFRLNINLFDGKTGKLLVAGSWHSSTFHGYPDGKDVIKELLDDMLAKLSSTK